MSREEKRPWWILQYNKRKNVSSKYRLASKAIAENKLLGNWDEVKRLKSLLRKVWWGIKRYNK